MKAESLRKVGKTTGLSLSREIRVLSAEQKVLKRENINIKGTSIHTRMSDSKLSQHSLDSILSRALDRNHVKPI